MKQIILSLGLLAALTSVQAQSKKELKKQLAQLRAQNETLSLIGPSQALTSSLDTFSYAMGVSLQQDNFRQQGLDTLVQLDAFYQGMKHAQAGQSMFSDQERRTILDAKFQEIAEAQISGQDRVNLEEGRAFLAANAQKSDVVSLPSGAQYKILKTGDWTNKGVHPTATDQVKVHYHGTLIDGTVFDSSVERGEPITFGLNQVIKGWTEVVQLMQEGDKWVVYLPFDLAYGARGSGPIGAYSTLIFEIELIQVNP